VSWRHFWPTDVASLHSVPTVVYGELRFRERGSAAGLTWARNLSPTWHPIGLALGFGTSSRPLGNIG